ncbi:MAG: protein kinase, partial [Planctomycetota bacterium]|nr:protein kinase [Planctomycetota bacterium]
GFLKNLSESGDRHRHSATACRAHIWDPLLLPAHDEPTTENASEVTLNLLHLINATPDTAVSHHFDSLIDAFEASWQSAGSARILNHLAFESTDVRYVPLLVELVKVDLEYRWRFSTGGTTTDSLPSRPRVEDYLTRFPVLGQQEDVVLDLIGEEFRVARRCGEVAEPQTYVDRFSSYAKQLPTYLGRISSESLCEVDETRFRPKLAEETQFRLNPAPQSELQRVIAEADLQFSNPVAKPLAELDTHEVELDDTQYEMPLLRVPESRDTRTSDVWTLLTVRPFSDLPPTYQKDLIRDLEPFLTVREFEPGRRLATQGQVADELLILMDGIAEVSIVDDQLWQRTIDTIRSKSHVGLFSLYTGSQHLSTVTATTKVRALALSHHGYQKLFGKYPSLMTGFAECLADELGHGETNAYCNKVVNGFLIQRFISKGAMASVYEAVHVASGQKVALKMLHHQLAYEAQAVARFQRESEALASMQHENVVRYYCSFKAAKTLFIVMEYVAGRPLSEVTRDRVPLPESEVRSMIGQLARAILHAHEHGIIHRDLKPANVMLQADGTVKLTDFGLAKTAMSMSLTHHGQILGTPRYMSPEQLMGRAVNGSADFFALGCMAYELLTGSAPFQGEDTVALLREQLTWKMPARNELPVDVSIPMYQLLDQSLRMEDSARTLDLHSVAVWAN